MVAKKIMVFIVNLLIFNFILFGYEPFDISQLIIENHTTDDSIEIFSETVEIMGNQIKSVFVIQSKNKTQDCKARIICEPIDFQQRGTIHPLPDNFYIKMNGVIINFNVENEGKIIQKSDYASENHRYVFPSTISFDLQLLGGTISTLEIGYNTFYSAGVVKEQNKYVFSTNLKASENVTYSLIYNMHDENYLGGVVCFNTGTAEITDCTPLFDIRTKGLYKIIKEKSEVVKIIFTKQFFEKYKPFIIFQTDWVNFSDWSTFGISDGVTYHSDFYDTVSENLSERLLEPYELIFLSSNQLRLVRNAFYAAHGYQFKSKDLQDFFAPYNIPLNPNFSESLFNEVERANIETIKQLENMKLPAIIE